MSDLSFSIFFFLAINPELVSLMHSHVCYCLWAWQQHGLCFCRSWPAKAQILGYYRNQQMEVLIAREKAGESVLLRKKKMIIIIKDPNPSSWRLGAQAGSSFSTGEVLVLPRQLFWLQGQMQGICLVSVLCSLAHFVPLCSHKECSPFSVISSPLPFSRCQLWCWGHSSFSEDRSLQTSLVV